MRINHARRATVLAALALLTALAAPALAGDSPQPIRLLNQESMQGLGFEGVDVGEIQLVDAIPQLQDLGMSEVETQFVGSLLMPATGKNYGFADDLDGVPAIDVPAARPLSYTNMQLELDPANMPVQSMGDNGFFVATPDLPMGNYTVLIAQMEGNFDGSNGLAINEGLAFDTPSGTDWNGSLNGDFWTGRDTFPTVRKTATDFSQQTFFFEPADTSFPPDPAIPSFTFRQDDILVVGTHTDALLGGDPIGDTSLTLVIHHSPQLFTPGSVYQGLNEPIRPNEPFPPGTFCCFIDPEPEIEPEVDPDAAVSDTPVTPDDDVETPELIDPRPGIVDPVDTPDGTTSGTRTWVEVALIVIGGITVAVGFWVYNRTRVRGGASTPETPTPTPPVSSVPREKHPDSACDWELEILEVFGWKKLKTADPGHHPCCVYRIEIVTTIGAHDQAASFRQDVAPERQYIPDFNFAWSALNFEANASTRSGPAGRQDWQHGLGNPIDQTGDAPDEGYRQGHQGDERPEVAAHLHRDETTLVKVTLESGCDGSKHEYSARGESTIRMLATQECTNDDPADGCPVELNAFGMQETLVSGDLSISTMHAIGTDIDELEGRTEVALWDSHDHDSRDRLTYEHSDFAYDKGDKESFEWSAAFRSMTTLDAAQIVPQHVWPTTERVSAHIEQSMRHELKLSGVMHKGDCETNGCCGTANHACKCAPEFELVLDGGSSQITVAGKTTPLGRGWPADREQPHLSGDTDTWEADPPTP